jgi:membrane protease YdiL (CAAX protease family)
MPSPEDDTPRLYHAPTWTVADAALTFLLAVGTFLLVLVLAGGGLAALVAAEVVGLALVPIAALRARGLPLATLGLVRPGGRAIAAAVLVGSSLWLVAARLTAPWARALGDEGEATRGLEEMISARPLAAIVLLTVVPAVCEEIATRGLLGLGLRRRLGAVAAAAIATAAFVLFHLSLVRAVPTTLLGVALVILTFRSGGLVPAMIAHGLNNAFALLVATGRLDPLARVLAASPDLAVAGAAVLSAAGVGIGWRAARPPS